MKTSTFSANAVFGVKAPSSQSLTLERTEQKLGLGDFDLALPVKPVLPLAARAEEASLGALGLFRLIVSRYGY